MLQGRISYEAFCCVSAFAESVSCKQCLYKARVRDDLFIGNLHVMDKEHFWLLRRLSLFIAGYQELLQDERVMKASYSLCFGSLLHCFSESWIKFQPLCAGRLDRKIEFPHPGEDARAKILRIHSRKMNVSPDVNYDELGRSTDDFNAAQLKAVCVEAGMLALRRDGTIVNHEDFNEAIIEVQAKKKTNLNYYA